MSANLVKSPVMLVSALLLVVYASTAPCQQPHEHGGPAISSLPVIVNGADAPDSIPEDLAYSHFVMALALPDGASGADTTRREAVLATIGVSADDKAALIAALKGVHAQLGFLERETRRLSASPSFSDARLEGLRLGRTRTLSEAHNRLINTMSASGRALLNKYITEHVKPRIVIYGDPVR